MTEQKKTLIVLLGPTGVGKTNISLRLANLFHAPIVSSDSRQFFRELKIGTAAPTDEELMQARHYFIGSHSIFDEYSAGQYEQDAITLLENLFSESPVALLVGGSMMYIDAICNGMDDIPTVDVDTRTFWSNQYNEKGLHFIQDKLKELDPVHYLEVDLNNYKRILHALEICSITGQPFSSLRTGQKKQRNFNILKIGLNRPRQELYERINQRVDVMMEQGLLEEAKLFYSHKQLNALNTVGYKELYAFMDGIWPLEFAINMIKQNSRHYAKRQLTWFNRDKEISWFHPDQEDNIIAFINQKIAR